MKKIFVILYGVCLLFLFGCVDHTAKKSQSDIEIRQRQCNILAVENKKIDYNKFIKEICGCDWDGTRRGEIAVDGVTHYWDIYDTSFIYYNDKILMDIDDKTARKISEDILSALDIDEWSGILKTKESTNGSFVFEYTFEYGGKMLLGNKVISVSGSDKTLSGSYIEICIDEKYGVYCFVSNLLDIKGIDEELYEEDFLTTDDVCEKILLYYNEIQKDTSKEMDTDFIVKESEIIYMPYLRNNQYVLMPVYDILIEIDGIELRTLVDVKSGYIYALN